MQKIRDILSIKSLQKVGVVLFVNVTVVPVLVIIVPIVSIMNRLFIVLVFIDNLTWYFMLV